jgi:hypothetical protein
VGCGLVGCDAVRLPALRRNVSPPSSAVKTEASQPRSQLTSVLYRRTDDSNSSAQVSLISCSQMRVQHVKTGGLFRRYAAKAFGTTSLDKQLISTHNLL